LRSRRVAWLILATAFMVVSGWKDVPGPELEEVAVEAPPATNVSNPVVTASTAAPIGDRLAALTFAVDEVVYVSLAADSFLGGEVAALRNPRNGARVVASLLTIGLDAVPVAASGAVSRRRPLACRAHAVRGASGSGTSHS